MFGFVEKWDDETGEGIIVDQEKTQKCPAQMADTARAVTRCRKASLEAASGIRSWREPAALHTSRCLHEYMTCIVVRQISSHISPCFEVPLPAM